MSEAVGPYLVEERHMDGHTKWVAIRARGAEWSWLTPAEAAALGRLWVSRYGHLPEAGSTGSAEMPVLVAAE